MLRTIRSFITRTRHSSVRSQFSRRLTIESLEDRRVMDIGSTGALTDFAFELEPVKFFPSIELSSKPGAAHTIYLDFDGHFETTWASDGWTFSNVTTTPFDTNGNTSVLTYSERWKINEIWQRVAEDFAPFDVNVTTLDPGSWNTPDGRLMRVAFGGHKTDMTVASTSANSQADWNANENSGYASIGSFTNGQPNVCYVFTSDIIEWATDGTQDWNGRAMLGREAEYMANVATHEVGHTMNLVHNHVFNSQGDVIDWYDPGTADRTPMMGESISSDRTTWAFAQVGATKWSILNYQFSIPQFQDDLAVLTGLLGQRADDHANSVWTATPLGSNRIGFGRTTFSAGGIVETMGDSDYFSFYTTGGTANFNVSVAALGANLDARLELYQMQSVAYPGLWGAVFQIPVLVAFADSANGLNASLSINLTAGTYYIAVKSHGTYGDLGQYTLTGNAPQWYYVFDTQLSVAASAKALSGGGGGNKATTSPQLVAGQLGGGGSPSDLAPSGPVAIPYPNRAARTHE